MNTTRPHSTGAVSELLVWPDGRIFAHNITPELAALLAQLDPDDPAMRARAQSQEAPLAPPVLATGPRAYPEVVGRDTVPRPLLPRPVGRGEGWGKGKPLGVDEPPHPGPLLHPMEERERTPTTSGCATGPSPAGLSKGGKP